MKNIEDVNQAFLKGDLAQALSIAFELIKNSSSDISVRTKLVEVLCFAKQWKRAQHNFIILIRLNPANLGFYFKWRQSIQAAQMRQAVFEADAMPVFLHEKTPELERALRILEAFRTGHTLHLNLLTARRSVSIST